jgi:hypothetical protein
MVLERTGHRSYVAAGITLLSVVVRSAAQFNDIPKTVSHDASPAMSVDSNNVYQATDHGISLSILRWLLN